jgi:hypothetical protein
MRDTAFAFFLAAVLCVTLGMGWGIQMGIAGDHTMSPAHAHLNLVGWVTLALFGVYYRLTPQAGASVLAKVHAVLAISGVAAMIGGLALLFSGGTEALAIVGGLLTTASMLLFLVTVLRHGFGPRPAAPAAPAAPAREARADASLAYGEPA